MREIVQAILKLGYEILSPDYEVGLVFGNRHGSTVQIDTNENGLIDNMIGCSVQDGVDRDLLEEFELGFAATPAEVIRILPELEDF